MRKNQCTPSSGVEMENKLHFIPALGEKVQINGSCQGLLCYLSAQSPYQEGAGAMKQTGSGLSLEASA